MRPSSDPRLHRYAPLAALLFVAVISAVRLCDWDGSFEVWLALAVLLGSLGLAARELRRF